MVNREGGSSRVSEWVGGRWDGLMMGLTAWDMLVIFGFSGVWMKGDFQGSTGIEYDPSICLFKRKVEDRIRRSEQVVTQLLPAQRLI